MPIKDKTLYPRNWPTIRQEILGRANHRCECQGTCGSCGPAFCRERDREPARSFRGQVILTVAHLNHNPKDNRRRNLRALCQRCHLSYDAPFHAFNASRTRDRKRGQLRLEILDRFMPRRAIRA